MGLGARPKPTSFTGRNPTWLEGLGMGFRMRKSIKVAPGVRLNVSKRGVGASVGAGGVRYSAHSSGRRTVSAQSGIPGVTYQKSVRGSGSKGGGSRSRTGCQAVAPPGRSQVSSRLRARSSFTRRSRHRTSKRSSR